MFITALCPIMYSGYMISNIYVYYCSVSYHAEWLHEIFRFITALCPIVYSGYMISTI